jgi:predicted short-subunit dehydrogenase-like oxidoreductase (DUF2520 family)
VVYHAGAVFASNYFTVVQAVAEQLMRRAGLSRRKAWAALLPLVQGTLENLMATGPVGALTGPVSRGDTATVRLHLEAVQPHEALLYRVLGRAALELLTQNRAMKAALARKMKELLDD